MAQQLVLLLLQTLSLLLLWLLARASSVAVDPPMAKRGCQESCGNVRIPYPFGIGPNCYKDKWYEVTCNDSLRPFLRIPNLEVLEITPGQMLVNSRVFESCNETEGVINVGNARIINLVESPFFFSYEKNTFIGRGCDNYAFITAPNVLVGCVSVCKIRNGIIGSACSSIYSTSTSTSNCCQTPIPYGLQFLNMSISSVGLNDKTNGCRHALMVDRSWFFNSTNNFYRKYHDWSYVPVVLDWRIMYNKTFGWSQPDCGPHTGTYMGPYGGYYCSCMDGYKGNPHLRHDYQEKGYGGCKKPRSRLLTIAISLGVSSSVGLLFLFLASWRLYQVLKKRRNRQIREKFFKRNGGMLLQQQISSKEGCVEKTKVFSAKELETATDHYNDNRILGQGGQGTVYKGMLQDGRIVAVKKATMVDEGQVEQFINEVVILSQINHRNVVKLLGCCLETEVPLLVYEFISNGTLFYHIHDPTEEFVMSWDNRLRIATEVAGALAYLHSAASIPIYHRDVKSTNILLDDKHRSKVSDFGTSRSVSIDKTHLTTIVQGTLGYLDPEYFQTSQFTDKSDVYSFGVVLVELLTGEKPISLINSQERRNLVTYFIQFTKENRIFEILDDQVVEGRKEEIEAVVNIAKRCLNFNGKKRPTMKEVAMELEGLRMSPVNLLSEESHNEASSLLDTCSTSTRYGNLENSVVLPLDAQPLLFNTY